MSHTHKLEGSSCSGAAAPRLQHPEDEGERHIIVGAAAAELAKWEAYHLAVAPPPWESGAPSSHLLAALADGSLPRAGLALEVGCGGGASARALARAGFHTAGVDISPAALARARAGGAAEEAAGAAAAHVAWLQADLLALGAVGEGADEGAGAVGEGAGEGAGAAGEGTGEGAGAAGEGADAGSGAGAGVHGAGELAGWRGACDAVFDLQAFHVFPPALRAAAAAAEAALLAPGGRLLLLAGRDESGDERGGAGSGGGGGGEAGAARGPPRLSQDECTAPFLAAGLRLLRAPRATRVDATPAYTRGGAQPPGAWECLFERPLTG